MSTQPPREGPDTSSGAHAPSLVVVNTGDGKGKTTAAMGIAMRAAARGWRVLVVQFIKSGDWRAGERDVLEPLGVEWRTVGDGFSWDSEDLGASAALAASAWDSARAALIEGTHDLIVLDEITYPMNWGWIETNAVAAVITERAPHVNVVATGREAPQALIDVAHTVTDMASVKHAFDEGILARRGIDF
jgi:cob(I)alamin adenosyltransferase